MPSGTRLILKILFYHFRTFFNRLYNICASVKIALELFSCCYSTQSAHRCVILSKLDLFFIRLKSEAGVSIAVKLTFKQK